MLYIYIAALNKYIAASSTRFSSRRSMPKNLTGTKFSTVSLLLNLLLHVTAEMTSEKLSSWLSLRCSMLTGQNSRKRKAFSLGHTHDRKYSVFSVMCVLPVVILLLVYNTVICSSDMLRSLFPTIPSLSSAISLNFRGECPRT